MSEVELGRLQIIKRRAWNKERCVCQWHCAVARAPTNGVTADRTWDVVSRNVQTSETEHFRTNVSYRPSAHRATGITAATSHTGAGTRQVPQAQRAGPGPGGHILQREDRAFVKSR